MATLLDADNTIETRTSNEVKDYGREALKDIAFGSLAGMVGKLVEYPFDTVKVRLQSQPDHLPLVYTGPLDCLKKSVRQDGIIGLYRGLSAPMVGAAAETACLFFTYRLAQDMLKMTNTNWAGGEQLPLSALATAGGISGGITSFILTPVELVKCRMQVQIQSSVDLTLGPRSGLASTTLKPLAVIKNVYQHEGLAGFWRGQLGTLVRETGGSAAWFGSYELLSSIFIKRARIGRESSDVSLSITQQMTAGAVAGVCYNFLFYPADTIKSKMQTGELGAVGVERQNFRQVASTLWRTHGLRGLYRGCGITMARSAPSSALIFTVYESLKKAFD